MGTRLDAAAAVIAAAVGGRSETLLVSGEAGIGKTTSVRDACDGVPARLVWAPCLPLTSLATPLLPLHTALRDVPHMNTVLDFDSHLDRMAGDEPVVLVVDDLQWADQSSLDVLMYIIAGRAERRLAILITIRTGEEQRLHRWLADVRRLPRVREIALTRLDRVSTRDQITVLLGRPPHESLVDDVYARSDGNPYLTKLLVRDLDPDARGLPPHLPSELRDALARTWRGLSAPARDLTSRIAVTGHPAPAPGPEAVPLLREAVDAGVLTIGADDRYWFAHPLLAEVLIEQMLPEHRRALHTELARTVSDPIDRADHYHRAGMRDEAYHWALVAADQAEASGGAAEAVRLLRRALRLRPDGASAVDLLHRARRAAKRACRPADELEAVDTLLGMLDHATQPLVVAELLTRRMHLRYGLGVELAGLDDAMRAERLSLTYPQSREHALAVAALASSMLWHGMADGRSNADKAISLAQAGGWPDAIGYALIAVSLVSGEAQDLAGGAEAARRAMAIGISTGDFDLAGQATYMIANTTEGPTQASLIDNVRRCREEIERAGAQHGDISEICSLEAACLLRAGDWRACLERLRETLGGRPSTLADARARNTAALLAIRQGRVTEAAAHAARAEELIAADFVAFPFDAVRAELAIAAGDTEGALDAALHGLKSSPPPLDSEVLLPMAARALADRVQDCRDRRVDPAAELGRLRELRERFPEVIWVGHGPAEYVRVWLGAMQCLAEAETARARRDPDETSRWHAAAEACRNAMVPWDESYCRWREAQSALRGRTDRNQGVAALRRAQELALDLQANPLLAEIDVLAKNMHLPPAAPKPPAATATIPGLTTREREVLVHLAAGETYSEIARALVLSEKTISAHVSNMLRKTGTRSRVDLVEYARRLESKEAAARI